MYLYLLYTCTYRSRFTCIVKFAVRRWRARKAFPRRIWPLPRELPSLRSTPDPTDVCASVTSEQYPSGAAALEPAFGCGDKSRAAEPQIPEETIKQQPTQAGARARFRS